MSQAVQAASGDAPEVSLSIVSHGHGAMVQQLLSDLRALHWPHAAYEVLLTLNTAEDTEFWAQFADLPLHITRNTQVQGFGRNHNAAFQRSRGRAFAILNPDVRLPRLNLAAWLAGLHQPEVGCCAPLARNSRGQLQDNARHFPTLASLARRTLTGQRQPSYAAAQGPQFIDWAAGYFLLLRRQAFEQVGGFDERYFLYMEDVDLGQRLRQQGWKVLWDPSIAIIHNSQRASHRNWQHLKWHVRGVLRYFLSKRADQR
jgi:N-acetylglucosaminyl-diphospho-decaprenol L-rhamnosyltransferase